MNKPTIASIIGVIFLLMLGFVLLAFSIVYLFAMLREEGWSHHLWVFCLTGLVGAVNCVNLGVWLRKALRERKKR